LKIEKKKLKKENWNGGREAGRRVARGGRRQEAGAGVGRQTAGSRRREPGGKRWWQKAKADVMFYEPLHVMLR
jgi:hypothetical protein